MPGGAVEELLPAADDRIDIARVELRPVTSSPLARGGNQGCAAAEKAVEHDVAARRAVEDRIGYQGDRFHRRMQRQQVPLLGLAREGVDPGVSPNIAAVAA